MNKEKNLDKIKKEDLNRKLLDELVTMITTSYHTGKTLGLSYGMMGLVVFLFHYVRQTQEISFLKIVEELIDDIQSSLNIDVPLNYANGLTGIGTGIEYLVQQGFFDIDTDEILDEFDNMFIDQINNRKLYLSLQDLVDLKRFFSARLENPKTNKRDFLNQTMREIITLIDLHERISVTFEDKKEWKSLPDNFENWGLEGYAGKGLALLSAIDPQHNSWLKLK